MTLLRSLSRAAGLTRIQQKYTATCFDLRMTIEPEADGWKAQVFHERDERRLHSAHRCSMAHAKLAAAEFAVARMTGALDAVTVEVMARNLSWAESW
jgi:DNA-binding FadR family transcriptional regulator